MRVLVVEDEEQIGRDVARALKEGGFAVELARSGHGAWERGGVEPYDAVVADLDTRVSRELARAQILGPSPRMALTPVAPLAERLVKALASTQEGERLSWIVDVDPSLAVRVDAADLTELIASLAHNASKWATEAVRISATGAEGAWAILIDDDGPGIPLQDRRAALARGNGLDAVRSGSGLGLAIAHDIARAYSASLRLEDSPMGGLRVRVTAGGPQIG